MRKGKPPKAEGRQRSPDAVVVALPDRSNLAAPDPDPDWLPATTAAWDSYWASEVAGAALEADLPLLRRYFAYLDEWQLAMDWYRSARIVEGHTGQPVLNPMGKHALALEAAMRKLEDEFGLAPYARAKLGIEVGKARTTMEDVIARMNDADHDDPR